MTHDKTYYAEDMAAFALAAIADAVGGVLITASQSVTGPYCTGFAMDAHQVKAGNIFVIGDAFAPKRMGQLIRTAQARGALAILCPAAMLRGVQSVLPVITVTNMGRAMQILHARFQARTIDAMTAATLPGSAINPQIISFDAYRTRLRKMPPATFQVLAMVTLGGDARRMVFLQRIDGGPVSSALGGPIRSAHMDWIPIHTAAHPHNLRHVSDSVVDIAVDAVMPGDMVHIGTHIHACRTLNTTPSRDTHAL